MLLSCRRGIRTESGYLRIEGWMDRQKEGKREGRRESQAGELSGRGNGTFSGRNCKAVSGGRGSCVCWSILTTDSLGIKALLCSLFEFLWRQ